MNKPIIRKCRRCHTWEICYFDGEDLVYYVDGFRTWREAFDHCLQKICDSQPLSKHP